MLLTVHCNRDGVRVSQMTMNGEEVLENVDQETLILAARLWNRVTAWPLEGHAALDDRTQEVAQDHRALASWTEAKVAELERRVSVLEQSAIRRLLVEPTAPPRQGAQ
jgi:hypothetical protein